MAYIDFSSTPVKENDKPKPIFDCENCIHRIFIPGGIYRCSITNQYFFPNQKLIENCLDKDVEKSNRKCIVGLFTFNKLGDIVWTGALTFIDINGIDDGETFKELAKNIDTYFKKNISNYDDICIVFCLIAESKNNNRFVSKTKLLPDNVINEIITDANNKFLK